MAELVPGSVVAGCRVEAVAGRGGMGVVYRATQLSLERLVALKAIAPELADDPTFRERFKRESRIAASIEHPNVIPVYEAGEGEGVLYLIMRYVEGTDLRALIDAEGVLRPDRAAGIVAQVAAALSAAHRRDLIHRDVKPANVLIDAGGEGDHAYLTDFGIARNAAATSALTQTGSVIGTLDYLAPERVEGDRGDGRSDVYALGCVLFEALTGTLPYARDNDAAKMFAHLSAPVPSARSLSPEIPEELDSVARRAMAKKPAERFATAGEMAQALTVALPARPAPPAASLAPPAPADAEPAATEPEPAATEPAAAEPAAAEPAATAAAATEADATRPAATEPGATRPAAAEPRPAAAEPKPATAAPKPAPAAPKPATAGGPRAGAPPTTPARRRVLLLAGGGLALAAVVVALLLAGGGSPDEDSPAPGPGGGGGQQDDRPLAFRSVGAVSLDPGPDGLAVDDGTVWVANRRNGRVIPVDEDSASPGEHTMVGPDPDSLAVGFGSVWVTNTDGNDVSRIDPESGEVMGTIDVGARPEGIAVSDEAVWVANGSGDSVTRISPDGGTATTLPVGDGPVQIAVTGDDRVWVTLAEADRVVELDRESGEPIGQPVRVTGQPRGIAFDGGRLWVAATSGGYLTTFRPDQPGRLDQVARIRGPREVRFGLGAIWVTTGLDGRLIAIDPETGTTVRSFAIGRPTYGLAVSDRFAWAASERTGRLVKIAPSG
jgi:YVTN family beta-propeller protein